MNFIYKPLHPKSFNAFQVARGRHSRSNVLTCRAEHTENNDQINTRRQLLVLSASLFAASSITLASTQPASAANSAVTAGLSKYVKKKKIDRIDTYIPALLNAKNQLVRIQRVMLQDAKEARKLLRSGAFSGLRDSVRSVGEYAAEHGSTPKQSAALVSGFLSQLESLDFELFSAVRNGETIAGDKAKDKLDATVKALDALLEAVPGDILERAAKVLKEVESDASDGLDGVSDEEIKKQLENLLI